MRASAKKYVGVVILVLLLIEPFQAFAYIDPGSGGLLIQMLIASAVGATVIMRTSWGRIKVFIVRIVKKEPKRIEKIEDVESR